MIRWCTIPEIWCATDGWPDAQEKWYIGVGAQPKNNLKEIYLRNYLQGMLVKIIR